MAELVWSASSASPQLNLFPMGLNGIGTGSQLTKGTGSLVPKGCALTQTVELKLFLSVEFTLTYIHNPWY